MTVSQKSHLIEFVASKGIVTAMTCAREIGCNWHDCSDYLDQLHTKSLLKVVGHDSTGMTQYSLNK